MTVMAAKGKHARTAGRRTRRWLFAGAVGGGLLTGLAALGLAPGQNGAEATAPRGPRVVSGPVSALDAPSVARCPRGTSVINGGYVSHGFRTSGGRITDYVVRNAPLANGKGWQAKQLAGRVQAYAVCVTGR
ncbi:hypothetical protein IHE55_12750 [Streptomyces pactum]|uniref:Secreted protein n=1 Tax=Streptomyces pactum TaxID=68249 RepID=A0ABS0NKA2_9ACTN|nr:hypothetical protein [Streptomyces pactum]MBH5335622.1 hypothetical protein [Streptomyces pactum]